jgi:hypothetical protein
MSAASRPRSSHIAQEDDRQRNGPDFVHMKAGFGAVFVDLSGFEFIEAALLPCEIAFRPKARIPLSLKVL